MALLCIAKHVSHIPARRVLFGPVPTLTQIFSISGEEVGKLDRALFHRGICSLSLHFLFDLVKETRKLYTKMFQDSGKDGRVFLSQRE